ncbi:hypothetical protein GQ43DRAFT_457854 [Delitschia confertaspora ATCC 74209]|uniref:CENP-V/GFA domain-containing protein n=1 Tax=Delitschia confertaspora ATCC 74209 TaxID=1513339 RepID=A0A9P4MVX0_9PLEO|nr:hypothetical protein GQ43DRAFT_457854 [Delitschia confertaspora ATCC 74209]
MAPITGDPKSHDISEFSNGITGTCLCGSISVTIHDPELFNGKKSFLCHCANCRKVAGSVVASNLIIDEGKVEIKDRDGTLKTYMDYATGTGKPVARSFCGVDGNPIKSETELLPGNVILKMGIFPRIPEPGLESFWSHKHDWLPKIEGTTKLTLGGGSEVVKE